MSERWTETARKVVRFAAMRLPRSAASGLVSDVSEALSAAYEKGRQRGAQDMQRRAVEVAEITYGLYGDPDAQTVAYRTSSRIAEAISSLKVDE